MRKIAEWPPQVGSAEHASFIDVNEDPDKNFQDHSHKHPDAFVPEKSVLEDQESVTDIEGGIISPVDGVDWEYNMADDGKKASVEVYNDDSLIAVFSCNVAMSFQDKVAGLQVYPSLEEGAGLLFPYRRPEDVLFHMGTVKYPIDIIFVDANNTVKRIYKNIEPGTLGTFGCANISNVLEICGGLSTRLGIKVGSSIKVKKDVGVIQDRINKIASQYGVDNDVIIKYSKLGNTGLSNWKSLPILTISTSLNKYASEVKPKIITDLISSFKVNEEKEVLAFDFDGIIESASLVRVYKTAILTDDNTPYIRMDGHVVALDMAAGDEIYRYARVYDLPDDRMSDDEAIIASLNKSFEHFMRRSETIEDTIKLFKEVRAASNNNSDIVFVTRFDNPDFIRDMVCSRIKLEFGMRSGLENIKVLKASKNADAEDLITLLRNTYGNKNFKIFSDESLLKRASDPVSDDIKSKAKRAYRYLDSAEKDIDKSLDNMQNNLAEYEKIKGDAEAIMETKDQYNDSMRRQAKIVKSYLVKIRESIRILNDIKDISTTFEVIDSLAVSTKKTTDGAEELFELDEKLDNPDFQMIMGESVDQYSKLIDDLKSSIERAKQYINKEILGLVVLSS
jgi:uncharacterized membrane protein (UPF0127 family)